MKEMESQKGLLNGGGGAKRKASKSVVILAQLGMFAALSIVLVMMIHFPIFPAAPFLEYDPADIPIFIATFLYGPSWGLVLTVVVALVQGFTVSAASGPIGIMMHIVATGSCVLVAGNIYKRKQSFSGALIALIAGALTMTAVMTAWNIIVTPIFMGVPRQAVLGMLLPIIVPFNLIKALVNTVASVFIFKTLEAVMQKVKKS